MGDHLRARRLDLGLRQKDVAQKLNIDVQSVLNWELGRHAPDTTYAQRIVQFLGYPP